MLRRLLALLGVLGIASALALVSTSPASAQSAPAPSQTQTVTFTSTPPTDVDWFYGNYAFRGYPATATASSGLPVVFSIAPESATVCQIRFATESGVSLSFGGPGTCTILADQPGNDEYLPAEQASQSFVVGKVQPSMSRLRGSKGVPGVVPATFRATLLVPYPTSSMTSSFMGYAGQVLTFSVAGKPVCSGTTNADGVATCQGPLPLAAWTTQLRFTASYAGNALYKTASANGIFVG